MLRTIVFCAATIFASCPADAQWTVQNNSGELGGTAVHIALITSGAYSIGFRCKSDKLELVFMTPESMDDSTAGIMNSTVRKLKVRIDGKHIIELETRFNNVDEKLVLSSNIGKDLFLAVKGAKSKIAAVLVVNGHNFHEQTFNVQGSSAALGKLVKDCKI